MPTLSAAPFSAVTLGRICGERRGRLGNGGGGPGTPLWGQRCRDWVRGGQEGTHLRDPVPGSGCVGRGERNHPREGQGWGGMGKG